MLPTIQGLWVGDRLSPLEQLSIRSFLAQGHTYELYTYQIVDGVPAGTTLRNAWEILPPAAIFKSRNYLAAFADFFRWKLLAERGGWWADLDFVALRPFDFREAYVLSSQHQGAVEIPTSGVARAPAGAPALRWMWETCRAKNPAALRWTEVGPDLVRAAVGRFALERFLWPAATFCPVPWMRWGELLAPRPPQIAPAAYAVHLWSSMWTLGSRSRDGNYPPTCLFEVLKRQYPA